MENWQEQFNKQFGDFYGTTIADKTIMTLKASDVKAFIQSLLNQQKKDFHHAIEMMVADREDALEQQRKELLGKIKLKGKDLHDFDPYDPAATYDAGYNSAVLDLEALKQSLGNNN